MNKITSIAALLSMVVMVVVQVQVQAIDDESQAVILQYENEIKSDGSYNWAYGTSNQIKAQESGVGSAYAAGSVQYVAPDGQAIQLEYTADEHGYQPRGAHLPTPPPIPDYILRGLAYIEAHPFTRIQLKK